jgi:hypothetical protein
MRRSSAVPALGLGLGLARALALAFAGAALALAPSQARAQATGFSASASLGGGGSIAGSRSDAASGGIFAAELGGGYDLGQLRPELSLLVGLAPSTFLGLRPGVAYLVSGMPFHLTAGLDLAAPHGSWRLRWLLGGGGAEVRLTDQLGLFAEARAGIPLASNAGLMFEVRAGARFRL